MDLEPLGGDYAHELLVWIGPHRVCQRVDIYHLHLVQVMEKLV